MLAATFESACRIPTEKKLRPHEEAITKALVHPQTLKPEAYKKLRAALAFNEDAMHEALLSLLEALQCDHVNCTCALHKASDEVHRAVATAHTHECEETGLLARTFIAWCRNHRRLERRRGWRERLAAPSSDDNDSDATKAEEPTVKTGEISDLCVRVIAPIEAATDRPKYREALLKLFAVSESSPAQTDAFVTINVRDGREVGNAVPESVRRAASVARKKIDGYRAENGLHDREDFDVAMEDGSLDRAYAMSA
ncbi:MAG: hypothetical protein HY909_15890 [Deltaproteobacteria bacterium]|nr:hypothetical protein [Deltaproteobacteria bacterium]